MHTTMLPIEVLLDILKCLSRDDLERIQVTNRSINHIVNCDFASYPIRTMPDGMVTIVAIKNGELLINIRDYSNKCCFMPNVREWHECLEDFPCDHLSPVNVMRPFLSKTVRFDCVIRIDGDYPLTPYTTDHISTLESISHIWNANLLCIIDDSNNDANSLGLILRSSSILQCRTLISDGSKIQMLTNSNVYKLYLIFLTETINHDKILQIIRLKQSFPQSKTIFMLQSDKNEFESALETIRQEFLASKNRCLLRVIMETESMENISTFRLQNNHTNEVLEMKHVTEEQMKTQFDVELYNGNYALLLERFAI